MGHETLYLKLSENMLPIAIFQCYFCGLFEATFVVTKKEIVPGPTLGLLRSARISLANSAPPLRQSQD